MFNVIKPLCLAALTLTAAACGGVGSEAVAPASARIEMSVRVPCIRPSISCEGK